jgi:putative DNA primase/helicase
MLKLRVGPLSGKAKILADNPNGVLAFRDELISLLKTLDREEYVAARGFFLTAWNGTSGYTFDRIVRGHIPIEAACVRMLGSTQPAKIAEYARRAISGPGRRRPDPAVRHDGLGGP